MVLDDRRFSAGGSCRGQNVHIAYTVLPANASCGSQFLLKNTFQVFHVTAIGFLCFSIVKEGVKTTALCRLLLATFGEDYLASLVEDMVVNKNNTD